MTDTRQSLAALLPCPFCGNSKGLAVANENPQDLSGGYFIACPSCDASTGLRFACGEDPIPLLIEQWNRRAALSAQPVAGAVAVDETGWLIEHSGEILPGVEQRAQVGWLRVQMKFNGYGAREFGLTHDANEALRFARKEDAEAVLAMHLGASPPDWYSKPFSVTEHMWPLVPQAQAAPAPEPSRSQKMREAGFTARDTRLTCDECGAKFTRQFAPLHECAAPEPSAQAVMTELEQRLIEIAKALPPMTTLGWNDGGMCEPDEAIKGYTKKQVLEILAQHLSASPQPEPSAQGEPVAWRPNVKCTPEQNFNAGLPNQQTIDYWKNIGCGIEYAYAAPSTPPPAVVEAVPLTERWVVVCESVLDVGFGGDVREGGRPELGYALLANATTFDSEDKAKAAIRNAKLPIGWVYMPLSRLLPDLRGIAPKAAQEKT